MNEEQLDKSVKDAYAKLSEWFAEHNFACELVNMTNGNINILLHDRWVSQTPEEKLSRFDKCFAKIDHHKNYFFVSGVMYLRHPKAMLFRWSTHDSPWFDSEFRVVYKSNDTIDSGETQCPFNGYFDIVLKEYAFGRS